MINIKIDKSRWKKYRFDEIAQNISQRVEPQQTDLKIYVGLEHLDPDSLHVKRFGTPKDVEGTKLKVFSGDVIFGKRRAYQRKAALANFDGICSAHAMVLRAKTEVINERLFPFFFHSKKFQETAITISVGGLSPTINWKDIAKQEFLLPPKNEQKRLAELLWAADEVVERNLEVREKLKELFEIMLITFFENTTMNKTKLSEVANIVMGQSPDGQSYNENGDGMLFLQGNAEFTDFYPIAYKYTSQPNRIANEGDVLMSVRAPVGAINVADQRYCIGRGLCSISMKNGRNNYLKYFLLHSKKYFEKQSTGSTFKAINGDVIKNIEIPYGAEIDIFTEKLETCERQIINLKEHISNSQHLKSSLINQIF